MISHYSAVQESSLNEERAIGRSENSRGFPLVSKLRTYVLWVWATHHDRIDGLSPDLLSHRQDMHLH